MRHLLWAVLLIGLFVSPSRADDFQLPGVDADARAYVNSLTKRFPAGGTPAARRGAEQRAAAALGKRDWAGAIEALELRVALGDATPAQFLDLGTAFLRRTPPDAQKALLAGWQSFSNASDDAGEIAGLLVVADALRGLDRPAQVVETLRAVVERDGDNANYKRMLAEAQRTVGMLVRRVTPEGEADPPRACIDFTVAPTKRADFVPQDWVKLDPAIPGAAVTREGDQLCISGLASGSTTRVTLRAGLPAEQDLSLRREATLSISLPNRAPRIVMDGRLFVLPRGQATKVNLSTTNLSAVDVRLIRLSERNVTALLRRAKLGEPMERWGLDYLAENNGRVVWEGKADVPKWEPNKPARTALPLPDALTSSGPGVYLMEVTAGDGQQTQASAVQVIIRTDLAPTVWRGSDGLTVQVRGYGNAAAKPGVKLSLVAHNNDILGEATTDADGVARFPVALLRGDGPLEPDAIHLFGPDEDFAALDLNVASFDLSDRGVEGMPHPGPLDAYVWLDRGIYRPGETVRVMGLVRDAAGLPADIPAQLRIKRPNGQTFLEVTPPRGPDASIYAPVQLSQGAAAGTWTVELRADPDAAPIGTAEFRVDAFIPDRMAVDVGDLPKAIVPGTPANIPVTARYLYGAPGAGLTGTARLSLVIDPAPFADLKDFRIGLAGETYAPDARDLEFPDTDGAGKSTVTVKLDRAPDTTQALKAQIDFEVNDPSGHGSRAQAVVPVRGANPYIGIRPAFADNAVDAASEAAFDIAAVTPDGVRTAMKARLRLVRERPDWRVVMRGNLARYETVWKDAPLETQDIVIPAGELFHFAKRLDFGRYRIEVSQADGLAATSYRFRSGWTASDSPDVPDRVDVSADRRSVPVGESVRVHIAPPFAGEATLAVLSDRVLAMRSLSVPEGGTDVDVPVETSWGPGAYVAVHVFRGAKDAGTRPARAIGLTWVGVDPAARTLAVSIDTPEKTGPRARTIVPVKTAPGAWVTLAAVDEGILRLTRFVSPDPTQHFLGRRRLGLDIRDDWGRLIAPAEGEATLLRQGADEGSFVLPDIPIRTVTLFTPPVQVGADGVANIPLDLPDFNGEVRLMVVAWQGSRIGAASKPIVVRDPLIAEALLPRFLAPGDEARLSVLLHNLDLSGGEAVASVSVEGPLSVSGNARLAATLSPGAQAVPWTTLKATGAGRGVIKLAITGPDGFRLERDTAITIRPSRGPTALVASSELPSGATLPLMPPFDKFISGTARGVATFGAPVRFDVGALVQELTDYPLSCLEQTTSRGLPLAMLPDGPIAGLDRAGRLQVAVSSVLDRQRYDGAFSLWSANGEAEPWLTPYATEFLIRAKASGAVVPDIAFKDALKYLAEASDSETEDAEALAAQSYRLYVLAMAGQGRPGAARVLAENLDKLPTPLARAQLGAALALAHDRPRAEAAFKAALDAPARRWWYKDYGSALRDQMATAVLLKESGLLPDRLTRLVASLPGADLTSQYLNTQEEAWSAAAAAALGRDGTTAHVTIDGKDMVGAPVLTLPVSGPMQVRNTGDKPVWESLSVTGILAQAPPAARNGLRVTRKFLNPDGSNLDLDHLRQNTVFVMTLEGHVEDGQEHRLQLLQGLPAGWELAGRLSSADDKVPGMPWLGALSATEAEPAADDRYAAVLETAEGKPDFRVAVRVRAVTPGNYEIPGAELTDMYRPGIFARQGANRITVQASE